MIPLRRRSSRAAYQDDKPAELVTYLEKSSGQTPETARIT